ncbi:beta-1,3-galactosyltransferase 1-like [Argopecten irradians]|uniref:beta-1,3-galactosyltransferase 1-like n=1 Tax=Argopecten irradians TaxID=31199 RepID=UPI003711A492
MTYVVKWMKSCVILMLLVTSWIFFWTIGFLHSRLIIQPYLPNAQDAIRSATNVSHPKRASNNTASIESLHKNNKSSNGSGVKNSNTEKNTWKEFPYPLDIDTVELVRTLRSGLPVVHRPIFPYPYQFNYHHPYACTQGSSLFIFLIKSAIKNYQSRMAVRETWANTDLMRKYNFIRMFLLGTDKNEIYLSAVKSEYDLHKDMLLMSFHDDYHNLTLKTTGGIHWTAQHCNRSKFVVSVDDDMLVSTERLVHFLETKATPSKFFGGFVTGHKPLRDPRSKWYVSNQDYPHDVYPPMPSGGFIVMSMDYVVDLHFAAPYTKMIKLEDCFLGIMAYKLHVTPVFIRGIYVGQVNVNSNIFKTSMIAAHSYSPSLLKQTWIALQKFTNKALYYTLLKGKENK